MFSSTVTQHWLPGGPEGEAGQLRVVVDADLPANRAVMILAVADGPTVVSLTPAYAEQVGLSSASAGDPAAAVERIERAGIALHDPDHLFYLAVDEQARLGEEPTLDGTRPLTGSDAEAFARFVADAPEDDVDEAFVELDHWLVHGTFVDDRLVAAASMYPWAGTRLADLGVLTLPAYRGRGLARRTVRAICARAIADGFEPQYRCQLDNAPSVALAASAGFTRFGQWTVLSS